MPHQVVKATSAGSVGDLFKITEALEQIGVNIVAVGGGEGRLDGKEVGVVTLLVDPDDDAKLQQIETTLKNLDLGNNRKLKHVEYFPDVHIELDDVPGQLKKAANAVAGINILSVISVDRQGGVAHVSMGFRKADHAQATKRLTDAGIKIVDAHTH